ncbi:hypothetical protein EMIHUDRAFT_235881 [Emiliania huxleyi CCMP1516]|uniref:Uncharacterized protein n=2 Tax=Emiliania huxleyi TaxID=2903 RepID=A0A0D3JV69_EMIH1|nr:hypothetical protein EMIHUDRAFT_235881 [Emiliania huxleyi CCMP1516]EOD27404.1 hypothetical protein EMIHUDRAFT_235881 [Emiliania huxleyi CCMP1516]|eukprot:XP_005779833.1 hypothetical protein EMIHUDRAFT_235881 [Emiliania huxleyi CCMP1516]
MPGATPDTPCRVHRLVVRGAEQTHESVIRNELRALRTASNLGEIHAACAVAAAHLESLQIFEAADFAVDRARADGSQGDMPLADVVVTVSERQRLATASTGVHSTAGEGSMDAEVRVRNLFGRAEPRWGGADARLHAEVCKTVLSHQRKSSRSGDGRAETEGRGCHEVSYEAGLREVMCCPAHELAHS